VEEIKQLIKDSKSLPEIFRMRYSGTRDDYLSFYDRDNVEMYFRYREDRFDADADKKIANLIPGQSYSVQGNFQGVLLRGRFYPVSHPEFVKRLSDKNSIPVFLYKDASPLKPDQILFGAGETFYDPRFYFQFILPELSVAKIYRSGRYDAAEIEAIKTRNYLITLNSYRIDKITFRPSPINNCIFDDIPFSNKIKIQKRCYSESDKIFREFIFYRKEEILNVFTMSYVRQGEESAILIMKNLVML
jgi:hypothetical protein